MQKDRKKGLDGLYLYVQGPYSTGMNNDATKSATLSITINDCDGNLFTNDLAVTVEAPPAYTNSLVAKVIRHDGTILGAIMVNGCVSPFGAPRGHYIRRAERIALKVA
jgi:hypothetical protein